MAENTTYSVRTSTQVTTSTPFVDTTSSSHSVTNTTTSSFTVHVSVSSVSGRSAGETVTNWRSTVYCYETGQRIYGALNDSSESFTFSGLSAGTNYTYQVRVLREINSTWVWGSPGDHYSQPVSTDALPPVSYHNESSNISSVTLDGGTYPKVYFSHNGWSSPSFRVRRWYLLRNGSTVASGSSTTQNAGLGDPEAFSDTAAARGQTHTYQLRVNIEDTYGNKDVYSGTEQITTPAFNPPTGNWESKPSISAVSEAGGIRITSNAPGTATGPGDYDSVNTKRLMVYRKPASGGPGDYLYKADISGTGGSYLDTTVQDYEDYVYYVLHSFTVNYEGTEYGTGSNWTTQSDTVAVTDNYGSRTISASAGASFGNNTLVNLSGQFASITGSYDSIRSRYRWEHSINGGNWTQIGSLSSYSSSVPLNISDTHTPSMDPNSTVRYRLYLEVKTTVSGVEETFTEYVYSTTITKPTPQYNYSISHGASTVTSSDAGPNVTGRYNSSGTLNYSVDGISDIQTTWTYYRDNTVYGTNVYTTTYSTSSKRDTGGTVNVTYPYYVACTVSWRYYGVLQSTSFGKTLVGNGTKYPVADVTFGTVSAVNDTLNNLVLSCDITATGGSAEVRWEGSVSGTISNWVADSGGNNFIHNHTTAEQFRLQTRVDLGSGNYYYENSPWTNTIGVAPEGEVTANVGFTIADKYPGQDNLTIDLDANATSISATSGWTVDHVIRFERWDGSNWNTINQETVYETGTTNTWNRELLSARPGNIDLRAVLVCRLYTGGNYQRTVEIPSTVRTANYPFTGPTGDWNSPLVNVSGVAEAGGNRINFTIPTAATGGTGSYDDYVPGTVFVFRRVKGTGSWISVGSQGTPTAGQSYSILDAAQVAYTTYEYKLEYSFWLGHPTESTTYKFDELPDQIVEVQNTVSGRELTASGTVDSSFVVNDKPLGAYLDGSITAVSGAGTFVSAQVWWEVQDLDGGSYQFISGSSNTYNSLPISTIRVSHSPNDAGTFRYRMRVMVTMDVDGETDSFTEYVVATPDHVATAPELTLTLTGGFGDPVSNVAGDVANLVSYWDHTNAHSNGNITIHSATIEFFYRKVGDPSWISSTPLTAVPVFPAESVDKTFSASPVEPFEDYETYAQLVVDRTYFGVRETQTETSPTYTATMLGPITLDLGTPSASIDSLSRATVQIVVDNYSQPADTLHWLDATILAYDDGSATPTHQVSMTRISNPTFPENLVILDPNPIPVGVSRQYTVAVTVRNTTKNREDTWISAYSNTLVGIVVADRGFDVTTHSPITGFNQMDFPYTIEELLGPGYDNITNIQAWVDCRKVGDITWTNIGSASSTVVPFDFVGEANSALVLEDTAVYEARWRARATGDYLAVPFDYTIEGEIQTFVFNQQDNSGRTSDLRITSIGYGGGGVQLKCRTDNFAPTKPAWYDLTVQSHTLQRRAHNAGDTWVDVLVDNTVYMLGDEVVLSDNTGADNTIYDYRIKAANRFFNEELLQGNAEATVVQYDFNQTCDHNSIEYLTPIDDLLVNDYDANVTGFFSLEHLGTDPTAADKMFLRYEWAVAGTFAYTAYSAATMDTLPRKQKLQVREVWGRTGNSDEQPSNSVIISLVGAPKPLAIAAMGRYSGNRLTWTGGDELAQVEVTANGVVRSTIVEASGSEFIDGEAPVSTTVTYTARQFWSDSGFRLYSPISNTANASRVPLPPVPALPVIDSAAYMGRDSSNNPILHLAPQGTTLEDLKSPSPLSNSYLHSKMNFVVVTDVKTSTGTLDAATKSLLASRAFLCTIIDSEGAARSSEMVLNKTTVDRYGDFTARNTFRSKFSFGSNTAYYDGGNSINLPSWANSVKFYFLNLDSNGNYINLNDGTTDILLSRNNLKVAGNGLDNAKLLVGLGSQTDGNPVNALNYHDDIVPFDGGTVYGHTYTGTNNACIQILGTAPSTGWSITPNKGQIARLDGIDNLMPWWNAGFGRGKVEYLGTVNHSTSKLLKWFTFPETGEVTPGFYESTINETYTDLGESGSEVILSLPGSHQSGDMYGLIVAPTGPDDLPGTVAESYGGGKGGLVWTDFSSGVMLAEYTYYRAYSIADSPTYGEVEYNFAGYTYKIYATRVGLGSFKITAHVSGTVEGRDIGRTYFVSVPPLSISIIKMR